jgi:TRAP-type mannitol/chloroaromatic compound transport system substrate-binding protein
MCLINTKTLSNEVVSELAVKNKAAQKIYDSYNKFYKQVSAWYEISEKIYFNVR